eukprot:39607-Chlamydomonas_euryale.AAC.10
MLKCNNGSSATVLSMQTCSPPPWCAQAKAKVVRSYVDKMITLAKDGSLHARRQVCARLQLRGDYAWRIAGIAWPLVVCMQEHSTCEVAAQRES